MSRLRPTTTVPLITSAVFVASLALLLPACAKKPPAKPDTSTSRRAQPTRPSGTPTTVTKQRDVDPSTARPPISPAAKKRLQELTDSSAKAWCEFAQTAEPKRDRAILGAVLLLSFQRRRSEADRSCSFRLLKAMQANDALLDLARTANDTPTWLAILAWAGRNLRAKHFAVYTLGLDHEDPIVRKSAAAAIGNHAASPPALAVLSKALSDEAPSVRVVGVKSARNMDHPEAVNRVRERAKVETDATVKQAIWSVVGR